MGRETSKLGKRELLKWASETSGRVARTFEDLRDGDCIARLVVRIFPIAVDGQQQQPRRFELDANWRLVKDAVAKLRLPAFAFDRPGVQATRCRIFPTLPSLPPPILFCFEACAPLFRQIQGVLHRAGRAVLPAFIEQRQPVGGLRAQLCSPDRSAAGCELMLRANHLQLYFTGQ